MLSKIAEQKKTLEESVMYQECQTRRDNLHFFGIEEKSQQTDNDCKKLVLSVLENIVVPDINNVR